MYPKKRSTGQPYLTPTIRPVIAAPTPNSVSNSKIISRSSSSTTRIINGKKKVKSKAAKKSSKTKVIEESHENPDEDPTIVNPRIGDNVSLANDPSTTTVNDPGGTIEEDVNRNTVEPFVDEEVSREIAQVVASIVAEYELSKKDNPVDESDHVPGEVIFPEATNKEVDYKADAETKEIPSSKSPRSSSDQRPAEGEMRPTTVWNSPPVPNPAPSESTNVGDIKESEPRAASPQITTATAIVTPPPTEAKVIKKSKKVKKGKKSENSSTSVNIKPGSSGCSGTSVAGKSRSSSCAPALSRGAKMGGQAEVLKYLQRVQTYINHLGYHRDGEPEIRINYKLSMKMQMITAKDIIRASQPIKCLHAVILAVYFTNGVETVERFPIYFKSQVLASGREYKHIVLGIYAQGHFGALGISRDKGLQDKTFVYTKLSDLIFEYDRCYNESGHVLNEIKFGNVTTHDQHSLEKLFSKNGTVSIIGCSRAEIETNVERCAKQLRSKMGAACLRALRPDSGCPLSVHVSRSRSIVQDGVGSSNNSRPMTNLNRTRPKSMGPTPTSGNNDNISGGSKSVARIRVRPPKPTRK